MDEAADGGEGGCGRLIAQPVGASPDPVVVGQLVQGTAKQRHITIPQGQQPAPHQSCSSQSSAPVVMEIDSPDGCQGVVLVVDDLVGR